MTNPIFGYNIAPFFGALDSSYDYQTNQIFRHTEENDKMIEELDQIKNFMASINNDRKQSQSIDYALDPEKKQMVDKVREINCHLMDPNCYCWKNESIDALIENLNNHSKHTTALLNPKMMNITQLFQDRNRITEIIGEIVKLYREESSAIVRNQRH